VWSTRSVLYPPDSSLLQKGRRRRITLSPTKESHPPPKTNTFPQTTDKQWDTILALHNTQPFKLVRAAAPYFRVKDGEPRNIVNISSTSGLHGNAGQANYALAKAGVTGLTKTIAKEWGPAFGVRANTVAFGHIATRLTAAKEEGAFITTPDGVKVALGIPQKQKAGKEDGEAAYKDIPLGRPGTATEAAGAILSIVSPLMGYVSGQTLSVTGGRNMWGGGGGGIYFACFRGLLLLPSLLGY
jgi:3-oxoacyl-[acyl-carrier protein] reductase